VNGCFLSFPIMFSFTKSHSKAQKSCVASSISSMLGLGLSNIYSNQLRSKYRVIN
jgi:hypothetical protein